jgi:hypothetical protein
LATALWPATFEVKIEACQKKCKQYFVELVQSKSVSIFGKTPVSKQAESGVKTDNRGLFFEAEGNQGKP